MEMDFPLIEYRGVYVKETLVRNLGSLLKTYHIYVDFPKFDRKEAPSAVQQPNKVKETIQSLHVEGGRSTKNGQSHASVHQERKIDMEKEGFLGLRISYVGGNCVSLEFKDVDPCLKFKDVKILNAISLS
ncbi:hypothetical protein L1987_15089 [Smallanthus sonchifolius]|uniref:Uncharacterized protein n=1 Tax=Smallanthus sonchifolius TaxID=185202 RepID=A0ACB9J503_9ASTR|nr:hypothetical protein L1987_15089 [Smallanthus sonchifolius]